MIQNAMTPETFREWGWRLPFLISIGLVLVSLYIRLRMQESPIFAHIKTSGMTSARPLKEAFTQPETSSQVGLRVQERES